MYLCNADERGRGKGVPVLYCIYLESVCAELKVEDSLLQKINKFLLPVNVLFVFWCVPLKQCLSQPSMPYQKGTGGAVKKQQTIFVSYGELSMGDECTLHTTREGKQARTYICYTFVQAYRMCSSNK